ISNSSSSLVTGRSHTTHGAPTPGPPHVRSGRLLGTLPFLIADQAFSRSIFSSGIRRTSDTRRCRAALGRNNPDPKGSDANLRQPQDPLEGASAVPRLTAWGI